MQPSTPQVTRDNAAARQPSVTVFVCANSARAAETPEQRNRHRPSVPRFSWPFTLHQIVLPCVGRLQPEHILKAFEAGSDATVVIACAEDNCHFHEGSCRCHRRVQYVGRILDEVGLGSNRLILAHLPGSARQDLAAGEPGHACVVDDGALAAKLDALRALVVERLTGLPPDPMHHTVFPEPPDSELDAQDESDL
jgi:coenzyme F420-reducing hydrogenase delta subunit